MKTKVSPVAYAVVGVVVALIALLAYGVLSNEPSRSIDEALQRGDRVKPPKVVLPKLEGGGNASLAGYRGKVVVLNVWASWCEPCRKESPLLERYHQRMQRSGGTVLGVDTLDVKSDALDFIDEFKLTYPQLHDREGSVIKQLGVIAYPETFVIDRDGKIAALRRGEVDDEFMRTKVMPLL